MLCWQKTHITQFSQAELQKRHSYHQENRLLFDVFPRQKKPSSCDSIVFPTFYCLVTHYKKPIISCERGVSTLESYYVLIRPIEFALRSWNSFLTCPLDHSLLSDRRHWSPAYQGLYMSVMVLWELLMAPGLYGQLHSLHDRCRRWFVYQEYNHGRYTHKAGLGLSVLLWNVNRLSRYLQYLPED